MSKYIDSFDELKTNMLKLKQIKFSSDKYIPFLIRFNEIPKNYNYFNINEGELMYGYYKNLLHFIMQKNVNNQIDLILQYGDMNIQIQDLKKTLVNTSYPCDIFLPEKTNDNKKDEIINDFIEFLKYVFNSSPFNFNQQYINSYILQNMKKIKH